MVNFRCLIVLPIIFVASSIALTPSALAQTVSPSPAASPSLEQRVADLESYINNSARVADGANAASMFQADRIHPVAAAHPIILDNIWVQLKPLLK